MLWDLTKRQIEKDYPTYFDKVTVRNAIGNMPDATEDGIVNNPIPQTEYQRYLSRDSKALANHLQTKHSSVAAARMKKVNNGENSTVLNEDIKSVHSGSYGRLCLDEQAPTITTRFDTPTGGRFIHPFNDRTLMPREAARIQSLPDEFVFYGKNYSLQNHR